jgi:hypothetical protein
MANFVLREGDHHVRKYWKAFKRPPWLYQKLMFSQRERGLKKAFCLKRAYNLMRLGEGRNTVIVSISNTESQDPERLVLPTGSVD